MIERIQIRGIFSNSGIIVLAFSIVAPKLAISFASIRQGFNLLASKPIQD
jgi:hypothetical protein